MSATKSARKAAAKKRRPARQLEVANKRLVPPFNPEPLIFISHDSRDKDLAEAFSDLLSKVSIGLLKSFHSSDSKGSQGIEYGAEWFQTVKEKLFSSSDVVCLLTQRSLDRPWILYEAGVAFGRMDTPVLGLALGIPLGRVSVGPFAQFQNCGDDVDSLVKLVMQLLRNVPNAEPKAELITPHVREFKAAVANHLKKQEGEESRQEEEASPAAMFEEVKVMFQDIAYRMSTDARKRIPGRQTNALAAATPEDRVKFLNMVLDLQTPFSLLVLLSILKADFPWVYEAGMDCYREVLGGDREYYRRHIYKFEELVKYTQMIMAAASPRLHSSMTALYAEILSLLSQVMAETVREVNQYRPGKKSK